MFDAKALRKDFPILTRTVRDGKPLVYLDSTATSQKPQQVIDALSGYYSGYNANIHRGIHALAEEATEAYEAARAKTARGAPWIWMIASSTSSGAWMWPSVAEMSPAG